MLNRSKSRGRSISADKTTKKMLDKDLNFSWNSGDVKNFGFGFMGMTNEPITTEDIRVALDKAFKRKDVEGIRALSRHFFKVSGIYARAARYLAYLPTYDYMITPHGVPEDLREVTITRDIITQLRFLEKAKIKSALPEIALDTIVDGVSYVYMRRSGDQAVIQKLPVEYCRTTSIVDGFPTVEFDLRYFDRYGVDSANQAKLLNSMPPEIVYEYNLYKRNVESQRRKTDKAFNLGSDGGKWILLEPENATAFYFNASLQPLLANSLFAILDEMELKAIEKRKYENDLYNLIVQKFPFNDDDEPMLDFPEMQAFHESAKSIFQDNSQTDLLTTLGEISRIDLNDAAADPIDFQPWKASIYGELGISPQLFATEGNMALTKSIEIDEGLIFKLVEKFQDWLNLQLEVQFRNNYERLDFTTSISFPPITVTNRKEIAGTYKELATLGYSKILPALALGQSQLDILSNTMFENDILGLSERMKPLQSSHTAASGSGSSGGRPALPDSQKSDKTIANAGG